MIWLVWALIQSDWCPYKKGTLSQTEAKILVPWGRSCEGTVRRQGKRCQKKQSAAGWRKPAKPWGVNFCCWSCSAPGVSLWQPSHADCRGKYTPPLYLMLLALKMNKIQTHMSKGANNGSACEVEVKCCDLSTGHASLFLHSSTA